MDPATAVGISACAAQLANQALVVFLNLRNYYNQVRNAPSKFKALEKEITFLACLLCCIQKTVQSNPKMDNVLIDETFKKLEDLLKELLERLQPKLVYGIRRMKWPIAEREINDLLAKIESHKTSLNLLLNMCISRYNP